MDGTIIGQGTFVASSTGLTNPNPGVASVGTANPTIIQIPSGADWVSVRNYTQYGKAGTVTAYFQGVANGSVGAEFYWQRGMADGTGIVTYKGAATAVLDGDTLVTGGFSLYDTSGGVAGVQSLLGPPVATTASTNATRPVVSTANTAGISVGSVVRMSNTAQSDVNGIDMVVGAVTTNVSFTLLTATNALANVPGAIGGAGFYRLANFPSIFYPRRRYISNITQAVNAQVSVTVEHSLTVGQRVRFNIPTVSGMIQLNPTADNNYQSATILSIVDGYNFTINIDTTGFTPFTWPTIAQQPSSFPEVTPIGEDTAIALVSNNNQFPQYQNQNIYNANSGILADSTVNRTYLGMILLSGGNGLELTTPILGPAGAISWSAGNVPTGDVLYWVAGKSTYGGS